MNKSDQIRDEIFSVVWAACDTFRGSVDPAQYKDYVLTFLFLKYLSDVRKDKVTELTEKYKGNEERINRALKNERFLIPAHCTFEALYEQRNENNVGELIDIALTDIEESNREKLDNIFRNITFNSNTIFGTVRERNQKLKNLLRDFNNEKVDLRPSRLQALGVSNDVIGDVYEYLIGKFASGAGKKAGEFYTPSEVSTLLAKLVAPKPGDRICDPACGSFSLGIKAAREVGSDNFSVYGQESMGSTHALARMNAFLHGIDKAIIKWGDTLNEPQLKEGDQLMKFNIVVANPPFSLDKWGGDNIGEDPRFWRGLPPKSKGDYAFISHMIETLYPDTGRAGVIVPHGVLFRGSSEGKIRRQFIEENLLEAVIGLPPNLFYGTGIPAAILLFNKAKNTNTDTLFIDASKEYDSGKNQNKLNDGHIQKVLDTYQQFKTGKPILKGEGKVLIDKYAYRATLHDIEENDFNLNIPRYVDTFEEEEPVNLAATQTRIYELKNKLSTVEDKMENYLKELGLYQEK